MTFKQTSIAIALACVASTGLAAKEKKKLPNFSMVGIGFEHVGYQESVNNFLQSVGKEGANLKTDSVVINPIHRAVSFSSISEDYGFYIATSSTLINNLVDEEWNLTDFGAVQNNQLQVSTAELELKLAYNLDAGSQLLIGGGFNTYDFSRFGFKFAGDEAKNTGGYKLDNFLKDFTRDRLINEGKLTIPQINEEVEKSGLKLAPGAVSESNDNIEISIGYRYDTELANEAGKFHWFAGAELNFPLFYRVINSENEEVEHSGSIGDGYGVQGYGGIRYLVTKKVSLDVGLRAQMRNRARIDEKLDNGLTQTLPEITYTNVQYFLGINWRH
ncbi:hypothetical protein C2869_18135 [Saccharobesus litoralis]|uniref:Uncharacterized protein n=1 Tax=Saccharobesus litoralis TaxID=2172099 RepID=A0A2S0VVK9_9ALTE|nr:hypothetical protein [Saccharobesus litoralis]AWB68213.1 hypothetical protein C2869_18135 [Saccharobesus litoralis]